MGSSRSHRHRNTSYSHESHGHGESSSQAHSQPLTRDGSTDSAWSRDSLAVTSAMSEPSYSSQGWDLGSPLYTYSPQQAAGYDYLSPTGSSPISSRARSASAGDYNDLDKNVEREYICLYPGCAAKPFARNADLDRHYKQRHTESSKKAAWHCDYTNCNRRRDPFHRLDHFRDHLRQYHKEGIEKRGVFGSESGSSGSTGGGGHGTTLRIRTSQGREWWRCPRCLKRNYDGTGEGECASCKPESGHHTKRR